MLVGVEVEVGAEVVDVGVGVTTHEHAEEILDASPLQFDAKVGRETFAATVKVGQNAEAADKEAMNCLRQLSRLHFAASVGVVVAVGAEVEVVAVSFL